MPEESYESAVARAKVASCGLHQLGRNDAKYAGCIAAPDWTLSETPHSVALSHDGRMRIMLGVSDSADRILADHVLSVLRGERRSGEYGQWSADFMSGGVVHINRRGQRVFTLNGEAYGAFVVDALNGVAWDTPPRLPKWVRVMADYGPNDGVWDSDGTPAELDALPVPDDLKAALRSWQAWYDRDSLASQNGGEAFPVTEFAARGLELARRLKGALPPDWTVVYFDEAKAVAYGERELFEYGLTSSHPWERAGAYDIGEERVAQFFCEKGVGGGADPIGFLLASYATLAHDRAALRGALKRSGGGLLYEDGVELDVDAALDRLEIGLSTEPTWWEVVDRLFSAGAEREAALAQRRAIPVDERRFALRRLLVSRLFAGGQEKEGEWLVPSDADAIDAMLGDLLDAVEFVYCPAPKA